MPRTGLVLDPRFERHDTGGRHPERPERLQAIARALTEGGRVSACRVFDPCKCELQELGRLHSGPYIQRVEAACRQGATFIDVPDSAICPDSYEIALYAAGTTLAAVEAVMDREVENAFCAVRPPGHHAEYDQSMGFCLFNNVALAARRLISKHELDRVMIVDFDVHHCNGTQHAFLGMKEVLVCSIHGHPNWVYPGTGHESERGVGEGDGYNINIPMLPGAEGVDYRKAFVDRVMPAAEEFKPQFLLVSAGFDAHRLDPLAPVNLETPDYEWITRWLMDVAHRHCDGRMVSVLEGGYHLDALAACVGLHVSLLMDYKGDQVVKGHESGAW